MTWSSRLKSGWAIFGAALVAGGGVALGALGLPSAEVVAGTAALTGASAGVTELLSRVTARSERSALVHDLTTVFREQMAGPRNDDQHQDKLDLDDGKQQLARSMQSRPEAAPSGGEAEPRTRQQAEQLSQEAWPSSGDLEPQSARQQERPPSSEPSRSGDEPQWQPEGQSEWQPSPELTELKTRRDDVARSLAGMRQSGVGEEYIRPVAEAFVNIAAAEAALEASERGGVDVAPRPSGVGAGTEEIEGPVPEQGAPETGNDALVTPEPGSPEPRVEGQSQGPPGRVVDSNQPEEAAPNPRQPPAGSAQLPSAGTPLTGPARTQAQVRAMATAPQVVDESGEPLRGPARMEAQLAAMRSMQAQQRAERGGHPPAQRVEPETERDTGRDTTE